MEQRDAPVGGQAVLEGVMMRGVSHWALAVRKPLPADLDDEGKVDPEQGAHGDIHLDTHVLRPWTSRHRALRLPVIRGVVALAESLRIGMRALNTSATITMGEEEEELTPLMWGLLSLAGIALAVVLFFVAPVAVVSLFKDELGSAVLFWAIEGALELAIFLTYLWLISRVPDLRRVFEYHGAEHKTIACYEADQPLTPENAQAFPRLHPRCGTSFLLVVMIVAILVFGAIGTLEWYWLIATRLLCIPLIVGLSFEVIKFAGRNRHRGWVRVVMWPGLQLQKLTTREPDHEQLAVAIAALEAVLEREDPRAAGADERVGMEVVA